MVTTKITEKCPLNPLLAQLSHLVGKPTMWLSNRPNTNRAVQAQKIARGWKFWFYKVDEFYYQCSKSKWADQLRSYCEADLLLCFRLCRLLVFPWGSSINTILWFYLDFAMLSSKKKIIHKFIVQFILNHMV